MRPILKTTENDTVRNQEEDTDSGETETSKTVAAQPKLLGSESGECRADETEQKSGEPEQIIRIPTDQKNLERQNSKFFHDDIMMDSPGPQHLREIDSNISDSDTVSELDANSETSDSAP